MPERRTIVRRGNVLDIFLSFEFNAGIRGTVEVRDKGGSVLEHFEYSLNEDVVRKYMATLAARALRKVIGV